MAKNSSFDLDFGYGRKGEQLVEELLTEGKTIEVKRDRKWWVTNNLYIEVECWFMKSNHGSHRASWLLRLHTGHLY
jgi:hypothetical protein